MDKNKKSAPLVPVTVPLSFNDPNFVLLSRRFSTRRPLYQPPVPVTPAPTLGRELILRPLHTRPVVGSDSPQTPMEKLAFSLGFFEPIDKQKKCLAVFLAIVNLSRMGRGISSTTLSRQLGLSRGSTLNHLGTLMHRGLVIKKGRHYQLRGANLEATLLLVERDIQNWLTDAKTLARNWDELAI